MQIKERPLNPLVLANHAPTKHMIVVICVAVVIRGCAIPLNAPGCIAIVIRVITDGGCRNYDGTHQNHPNNGSAR